VGDRFELGGFSLDRCGPQVRVGRVVVGEMWATGSSWEGFRWRDVGDRFGSEGFRWRDVGDRFELGGFSLERCGRQVRVGRDVGDRFEFERFSLERCGRHVPIRTVNMERCDQTHLHET
jgi:hypothetical protein